MAEISSHELERREVGDAHIVWIVDVNRVMNTVTLFTFITLDPEEKSGHEL